MVNSEADISLQPVAFWPHHSEEKSLEFFASAACLSAPTEVAAKGNSGTSVLIGPTSRTNLLTILRAGLPENTLVIAVCWDAGLLMAALCNADVVVSLHSK